MQKPPTPRQQQSTFCRADVPCCKRPGMRITDHMRQQRTVNLDITQRRLLFFHRPNMHRGVIVQLAGRVEGGGDGTIGVSIRAAQPE